MPSHVSEPEPEQDLGHETTAANVTSVASTGAGTRTLHLRSPFQEPGTSVTLLGPERTVRRVVVVLPVERGAGQKYGYGLDEIAKMPAALRGGCLFAAPTFTQSPWLVNHASDRTCRQEDHLIRVVLPAVLSRLGGDPPRVHLLGFSKGGFAALNLLARHPERFATASVWDPSLLSERPPHPQLVEVAGSSERLDEYDVRRNLRRYASLLRGNCRIALGGVGALEADWVAGCRLLAELSIPHRAYRDSPAEHRWDVTWVARAMQHLVEMESCLSSTNR